MSNNQNSNGSLVSQLDQAFAFDSLAYHDGLPPKDQKQAANKLVDDELKRFPKVKNYLSDFPMESEKLLTPALKNLLKMAETNTAIDAIDESKFSVPDLEQLETRDPNETLKALELFEAQLMFMDIRKHHLQLAQKYAAGALRQTSSTMKYASEEIGRKATELKKETFEIHRERKREHALLGKQIKELEETWSEESQRVNQLREAIAAKKIQIESNPQSVDFITKVLRRSEQTFRDDSCGISGSLANCTFAATCENLQKLPKEILNGNSVIIEVKPKVTVASLGSAENSSNIEFSEDFSSAINNLENYSFYLESISENDEEISTFYRKLRTIFKSALEAFREPSNKASFESLLKKELTVGKGKSSTTVSEWLRSSNSPDEKITVYSGKEVHHVSIDSEYIMFTKSPTEKILILLKISEQEPEFTLTDLTSDYLRNHIHRSFVSESSLKIIIETSFGF